MHRRSPPAAPISASATGHSGRVSDSGEGRWTVQQAMESNVAAPVITLSLLQRVRSRKEETFAVDAEWEKRF